MAEQAPALPQAVVDQLVARATREYAEWKQSATDEQKQKGKESLAKFTSDEDFRNQELATVARLWAEADPSGEGQGKLNK